MSSLVTPALIVDGTLYTLVVFSIATWTLIIFKIWQLLRNKQLNQAFADAFWQLPSLQETETLPAITRRGPHARLAQTGITWLNELQRSKGQYLKFQGPTQELLEQTLAVSLQQEQHRMESGLTLLASIGSTAPFVGLLGTVVGIMHALQQITQSGSSSLDVVAGPIGDALIATAIGIAVAVPAVLAYNFLLRRVKLQRLSLENFATSFSQAAQRQLN